MKKVLKWTGIILLVLVVTIFTTGYFLNKKADKIMARTYSIDPPMFEIPQDSAAIAYGAKFATMCTDCHGSDYGGKAFFDDPKLGRVYAPNLTKGKGSAVDNYTDRDWILALRHGVRANGQGLLIMPAKDYYYMSKEDISSLIAYIKTLPPVDRERQDNFLTGMGKILLSVGAFGEVHSASLLNHAKGPESVQIGSNDPGYGEYMVKISGCASCHGEKLTGGKHPDPNGPPVPDLSSSGNPAKWSAEQFISVMRTGKSPEGKELDSKFMPYYAYAGLSDEDMTAVHTYLKSLPGAVK